MNKPQMTKEQLLKALSGVSKLVECSPWWEKNMLEEASKSTCDEPRRPVPRGTLKAERVPEVNAAQDGLLKKLEKVAELVAKRPLWQRGLLDDCNKATYDRPVDYGPDEWLTLYKDLVSAHGWGSEQAEEFKANYSGNDRFSHMVGEFEKAERGSVPKSDEHGPTEWLIIYKAFVFSYGLGSETAEIYKGTHSDNDCFNYMVGLFDQAERGELDEPDDQCDGLDEPEPEPPKPGEAQPIILTYAKLIHDYGYRSPQAENFRIHYEDDATFLHQAQTLEFHMMDSPRTRYSE